MGCWEGLYHAMGMVLAVEKHEEDMSSHIPETKAGTHLSGVHMGDAL